MAGAEKALRMGQRTLLRESVAPNEASPPGVSAAAASLDPLRRAEETPAAKGTHYIHAH